LKSKQEQEETMQPCRAQANRAIAAPADLLWSTISRMTGMEDWYPGLIARSEVDAELDQPTRFCVMRDGGELHERILLRDTATRTFVYAIDAHPLPARDVVGTIRIDATGDGSHVTWDAQFTTDPQTADQLTAMISDMYRAGLDSLAQHHNT
jgi:hypothetical protein